MKKPRNIDTQNWLRWQGTIYQPHPTEHKLSALERQIWGIAVGLGVLVAIASIISEVCR